MRVKISTESRCNYFLFSRIVFASIYRVLSLFISRATAFTIFWNLCGLARAQLAIYVSEILLLHLRFNVPRASPVHPRRLWTFYCAIHKENVPWNVMVIKHKSSSIIQNGILLFFFVKHYTPRINCIAQTFHIASLVHNTP